MEFDPVFPSAGVKTHSVARPMVRPCPVSATGTPVENFKNLCKLGHAGRMLDELNLFIGRYQRQKLLTLERPGTHKLGRRSTLKELRRSTDMVIVPVSHDHQSYLTRDVDVKILEILQRDWSITHRVQA